MNKGFRVLLQIFQVLFLLAALLFMTFSFLMAYIDFDATVEEERFMDTWIMGFALLSIAVSPALWALSRRGGQAVAQPSTGGFDRAAPPAPAQPGRPGGVFEPMNAAPAPPASSYSQQPQAGGYGGGITPSSPAQNDGPWGGGR